MCVYNKSQIVKKSHGCLHIKRWFILFFYFLFHYYKRNCKVDLVYNPSYAVQRLSERNENLDNGTIRCSSAVLAQYNPFARIYRHAYEILSNHGSPSIKSEDWPNNDDSTESNSSILPSVLR